MSATRSAGRRKLTCSFGAATGGRPTGLMRFMASGSSGSTSATGRRSIFSKSSSVSSRTSPSSSVRGRSGARIGGRIGRRSRGRIRDFAIGRHLFLVRLAETDHSRRLLAQAKTDDIQPSVLGDESHKPFLPVIASIIAADASFSPLQLSDERKRQRAFFLVLGALCRIELDLD
jgi:hypothetical protein